MMINFLPRSKAWLFKVILSVGLLAGIVFLSGTEGMVKGLAQFSVWQLILFLLLLLANVFVVSVRFWRVLAHYGFRLSLKAVIQANISGLAAGLVVIPLFGQVVGRQALLQKFGFRPVVMASLTAYERVIVTLISAFFCFYGASYIVGEGLVYDFFIALPIFQMLVIIFAGISLSLWIGRSSFEAQLLAQSRSWVVFFRVVELVGITIISQALLLCTFVLAFKVIAPDVEMTKLLAAAAIISFSASLPISIGGWGIRELTAVFILGELGIAPSNAIAASVMVGLLATFAIIILTPFAFKKPPEVMLNNLDSTNNWNSSQFKILDTSKIDLEKLSAWILSMSIAILVFFQVHVDIPIWHGSINLNLADPFAILALAAVSMLFISIKSTPVWRIKQFNKILLAISALLIFSFLNGVMEIGVTPWAFAGRLMGWLVLLGYVAGGYLIVMYAGNHGLRRMSETMISVGAMIVLMGIISRLLYTVDWLPAFFATVNFEGFAANRNAFSLQMLVCMVLLLSYSLMRRRAYPMPMLMIKKDVMFTNARRSLRSLVFPILLGIIMLGILLSASRAGILVGIGILGIALILRLADFRTIMLGLATTALMWGITQSVQSVQSVQSDFSSAASDDERMKSILIGWDMWLQSPLVGAGLGVFTETKSDQFEHVMVIHSTPVWILAEFGIIGFIVIAWAFFAILKESFRCKYKLPAYRGALLLIIVFCVFSLAHEIFYQRIFWLVLGAFLACPRKKVLKNMKSNDY
jgi:uncharacterized membrane protein YbhN (UPF0104 family)